MFIPALLASAAIFIAQTTGPTGPAGGAVGAPPTSQPVPAWVKFMQSGIGSLLPLIIIMVLFIWMTTKSRRKQEKQKQDMIDSMKRGDRVQTIGGILGNVVEVKEDRILLKVDESNNTKMWFVRSAIHRVFGEEAEAKK